MRYLSVCSGIEAASIAWHPLGWHPAAFSEIEPFPRAVLAHHWPDIPLHGDFTTIGDADYGPVDLLVGGTPCQDFSVAGLRAGLSGERGNLTLEFLRLAQRLGPRWLVWENVPGVLSDDGGRSFGAILGGMVELGYGIAYRVLDAQFIRVDGFARAVPQRRRRVFVVGYLGDWRRAVAVLFERQGLSGDPAPRREAGQGATRDAAYGISPDCFDRSGEGAGGSAAERSGLGLDEGLSYSLRAKRAGGVAIPLLEVGKGSSSRGRGPNGSGFGAPGDPMFTLQAGAQHAVAFGGNEDGTGRGTPLVPVAFDLRGREGGAQFEGPHETANTRAASGGSSRSYVAQQWAVRRLTPRECERLQGFPDDFTAITVRGKPAADGPRYKALGNSMAVNCMRWIGQRIADVEALTMGVAA